MDVGGVDIGDTAFQTRAPCDMVTVAESVILFTASRRLFSSAWSAISSYRSSASAEQGVDMSRRRHMAFKAVRLIDDGNIGFG